MTSRLFNRVKELERLNTDGSWLVMYCQSRPSSQQIDEMEAAHAAGRFVILFISDGDTAFIFRDDKPKPWYIVH